MNSNQTIARDHDRGGPADARRSFPSTPSKSCPRPTARRSRLLLSLTQYVDLCMPRGGEGLIRAVADCSEGAGDQTLQRRLPRLVDADADLKMAEDIALNAKVPAPRRLQRDGNAAGGPSRRRTVSCPRSAQRLGEKKVELRVRRPIAERILQLRTPQLRSPQSSRRHRAGLVHRIQRLHPERARGGRRAGGD